MPDYPFRKFVVIPGHRDAEVGHEVTTREQEDYQHLDLIACSMQKNRGLNIYRDPEAIPDDTVSGWLLGGGGSLKLEFSHSSLSPRLKLAALEALTRWATPDYIIRTA